MSSRLGRRRRGLLIAAGAAALLSGAALSTPAAAVQPATTFKNACASPLTHHASCFARYAATTTGRPAAASTVPLHPYQPADLAAAYQLPTATRGAGQTIAIVDAYDDPNAEQDLATYRAQNKLAPCTSANGCFRKVNQGGGAALPAPDAGWGVEISLDLDMASAVCPSCHLLLVEGTDNSFDNLALAVDEAVVLKANVVSNSYGGAEFAGEQDYESSYTHPGTAIVVASGDNGFGATVPADYRNVISVGGTSLYRASGTSRGWAESAWSGAASGCSAYIAKPAWQHDALCSNRTEADVSAVADPRTPLAVYDTYGAPGWIAVGGTSAASPIVAGVIALAGNAATASSPSYLYAHRSALNDVIGGSNGYCGGSYLCTAVKGYDGPTGLGTPHGLGAF